MNSARRLYYGLNGPVAIRLAAVALFAALIVHCSGEKTSPQTVQQRLHLSDGDARLWEPLYLDDAETTATAFWGMLGDGKFDEAMLMIERFGDKRMRNMFEDRMNKLWSQVYRWPASAFTEEAEIGLGPSETVGFRTWGELWKSGFQRAVVCEDSITVYFVFKGYWKTSTDPLYAAVACGDFGKESPQWRPFPTTVFSIDASAPTEKVRGVPFRAANLDQFCAFLRTRTYGTFGI